MNKLFIALIGVLVAIGLGFLISQDSGFIIVGYHHYTLEMTLWVGITALFILHFLFNFIGWSIQKITGINVVFRHWKTNRKAQKTSELTHQGLCKLAMGEWSQAEGYLNKSIKHTNTPLINRLACAYASQAQQHFEKRDQYLRQAYQMSPDAEAAIGLTQAMLQINSQQLEQAMATLNKLYASNSSHPYILKLLAETMHALGSFEALEQLLPKLKRYNVFTTDKLNQLTLDTYKGKLEQIETTGDIVYLENTWQRLPRPWREDTSLLVYYLNLLIKFHKHQEAMNLIVMSQRRSWKIELLPLYSQIESNDIHQQITIAENWLSQHQNLKELILCLAQLSFRAKLYGRAEQLITDYLNQIECKQGYFLLGKIEEKLDSHASALKAYKKALSI